ncbi:sugar phosphate permease [Desulfosporosinus orientis DSM 765]|uniref:Sugar phosphate permease n=1 Tax=Desulfosporosinus orientis (strain ATCC 19365 / DSM 765 / NCIMB 8382 / VKM B-1628 / Singapore I) TaxID=768706 RepID=G7WAM8_DESOD|nr:MFS transporter [Desulfosporosinus orientis]AET66796.1 sugar phosphate permease [Desulfosporosinus orientis DSM 765]
MNNLKKWLALFALSFGYASIFMIPYAKYVFYDPMMKALNCTNLELGALVSVYVFVGIFTFVPGGWLADRFSARKIITISLVAQGIFTIWFGLAMTMTVAWIVWISFAFTNCFAYWSAVIKGVRLLGDEKNQGKTYGLFEAGFGLSSVIVGSIALAVFGRYTDQIEGFKMVVFVYSGLCILAGILTWSLYDEYMVETKEVAPKVGLKDVFYVLKQPIVWLIAIVIMTTYGLFVGQTYLTPYLTAVVGITVTFSGALSLIRSYGVKLFAGPLGGIIADKMKSPSRMLAVGYVIIMVFLVIFLNLSGEPSLNIVIALMMTIAVVGAGMKGVMWSIVTEANVPRHYTGLAIGTASIIGYLADIVLGPLFGYWMDTYGNAGYNYQFALLIGVCVAGFAAALGIIILKNKAFLTEDAGNARKKISA